MDTEKQFVLFEDDFSGFAIGPLPFDREHSATGEYHYVVNPGYQGSWYDPITNCWFRGPNWVVTSQDGMHVMEQMRVRNPLTHGVCSVLAAGDKDWTDYTADVAIPDGINAIYFTYTGPGSAALKSFTLS